MQNENSIRSVFSEAIPELLIGHFRHLKEGSGIVRCRRGRTATVVADRKSGNAHFWTDKEPAMCPQCGYRQLLYDEKIYRALNWPIGAPFGLKPE